MLCPSSFPEAEEIEISQPVFILEMLLILNHLYGHLLDFFYEILIFFELGKQSSDITVYLHFSAGTLCLI